MFRYTTNAEAQAEFDRRKAKMEAAAAAKTGEKKTGETKPAESAPADKAQPPATTTPEPQKPAPPVAPQAVPAPVKAP
jgi:hypothetical protein